MVWVMLLFIYVLYAPEIHRRRMFPLFLVFYATGFMFLHLKYHFVIGFQLQYFFLAMVCAPGMLRHYMRTTDCLARRLSHQYLLCFSCFIGIWAIDQKVCNRKTTLPVAPQWHALFHVLNGLNNYFGIMYLQYCRAHQLDLQPELRYIRGVLPYVKVLMKHQAAPVILAQVAAQELEDSKEL